MGRSLAPTSWADVGRQRFVTSNNSKDRSKLRMRLTKPWTKFAASSLMVVLVLLMTGCSMVGRVGARVNPPISFPQTRPALINTSCVTPEFRTWLESLIRSAEENCAALSAQRNENPNQCIIK